MYGLPRRPITRRWAHGEPARQPGTRSQVICRAGFYGRLILICGWSGRTAHVAGSPTSGGASAPMSFVAARLRRFA